MKDCTIYKVTDLVGKKWTLCILHELYKGDMCDKRFNELKNCLCDITPKTLSMRLKEMESEGLIEKRIDSSSFPVKCEYTLTDSGKELVEVVQALKTWGHKWKVDNEACKNTLCIQCKN
ncbi:putative HTH-type transcriptional regulator YybR [Methanosarcinaceae archaeon Ag5]|uniref:HTH-type transcriptional regulator YybR n=1 Tax=Methanolapillus africanus TaxID=3028297 RepID=A0AAE4SD98_9EURY|nr:putative HTH-type transcriptional regulator YybR [Methanosarcinaceae archaeon Ag5]